MQRAHARPRLTTVKRLAHARASRVSRIYKCTLVYSMHFAPARTSAPYIYHNSIEFRQLQTFVYWLSFHFSRIVDQSQVAQPCVQEHNFCFQESK